MIDYPYLITKKDLDILLKYKMGCETLPGAVIKNKRTRVAKWVDLRNSAANDDENPHTYWTEDLEDELQRIKNEDLTLKDTTVGQEKQKGFNYVFVTIVVLLDCLSGLGVNT